MSPLLIVGIIAGYVVVLLIVAAAATGLRMFFSGSGVDKGKAPKPDKGGKNND